MYYFYRIVIALFLLFSLLACSTTVTEEVVISEPKQDVFPQAVELDAQVDFWRKVYSTWSQGQVVLHDDRHLDLIYQVIDLPGPVSDRYNKQHRRSVRIYKKGLAQRLRSLENKLFTNTPLDASEQRLADHITEQVGRHAIFGAADRLRSQRGLKERFKRGLAISGRYDTWFRRVFREAGLPEDLAFLPHVESSFQAHARSSAGAVGMWQFTRGAARRFMNIHPGLDERLDPIASARGAANYLGFAYQTLGHWPLALTSYNHGIQGMTQAKAQFGNDFAGIVRDYKGRYFKFASRNFYAEFLAARDIARNPERYFPEGINYYPALDWDHVVLSYDAPISALVYRYQVDRQTLITMNPAWTRAAKKERVALPAGTQVWLPPGAIARLQQNSPALAFDDKKHSTDRLE